jgi:hypothetical protein
MVVNRPVAGVRNPIVSTSIFSTLRAKDGGIFSGTTHSGKPHLILRSTQTTKSEPGPAAGGGDYISE